MCIRDSIYAISNAPWWVGPSSPTKPDLSKQKITGNFWIAISLNCTFWIGGFLISLVLLINKFSIAFDKISIQPIFGAGKHTSKSCDTELPTTGFAFLYSKVETCFINFKRKSFEINLSEI